MKRFQENINPNIYWSYEKINLCMDGSAFLTSATRVQAQSIEGKAVIENIIALGDSILSLGNLSDVKEIMKPFGFKDLFTIKGNPYYEQVIGMYNTVCCAMLLDSEMPSLICKTKFHACELDVKTLQGLLKKYGYLPSPIKKNLYTKENRHIEVGKVAIDKNIDQHLYLITVDEDVDYVFYLTKSKNKRQ